MTARTIIASALAACCALAPLAAFSQSEPLQITNLSARFLRAIPAQRSVNTARGFSWAASASLSNHFTMENEGEESLLLDGQTDALTLSLRYGLPQQWDVEVTVPWRHYSGGLLITSFRAGTVVWVARWQSPQLSNRCAALSVVPA